MPAANLKRNGATMGVIRWRRALVLSLVATAISGGVAAAAPTWTYIINFSRAPVIDEGNQTGNYQIWGLGYARLIVGSRGSNEIVADGSCPPGSTDTEYCSVAPVRGSRNTLIYGNGAGPNTIVAGYGPSVIFGGTGPNTITSAPTASVIIGGDDGDTINANQGATIVYAGTGTNTIYALSPDGDTVYCSGTQDTVYAYPFDTIHHCAHVVYKAPPPGVGHDDHGRRYDLNSLWHGRSAQRLYTKFKAAERARH
jgi:hypothetical protein